MGKGLLITFSGIDGAGKSTQIELLAASLRRRGFSYQRIWSRGGYTQGMERLKKLLRKSLSNKMPPPGHSAARSRLMARGWLRKTWLILAMLDLAWVYGIRVRWLRFRGVVVLCDRYLWDTAFDFKLHFSRERAGQWWLWRSLERFCPRPQAAFLLMLPLSEALGRLMQKNEPFPADKMMLTQRWHEYDELAQDRRFLVLNASQPVYAVSDQIRTALEAMIER